MTTLAMSITGMSCGHCIRAVREALEAVPGVAVTQLELGSAAVSYDPALATESAIATAVQDAGYEAEVKAAH